MAGLEIVTSTPGTTAPVESSALAAMFEVRTCENAGNVPRIKARHKTTPKNNRLIWIFLQPIKPAVAVRQPKRLVGPEIKTETVQPDT
jgi:hypothetical protein